MGNQIITMYMHTLNKYGVPCEDALEYVFPDSNITIQSEDEEIFFLAKSIRTSKFIVRMKSNQYVKPDPLDPITGIEGFDYCVFKNDDSENGFIEYYSLASGALKLTVPLPAMVGTEITAAVDINLNFVVYDAVYDKESSALYSRFVRQGDGSLELNGQLLLSRDYKAFNPILLLGTTADRQPFYVEEEDINVSDDSFYVPEHEIPEGTIVNLRCNGTPPTPLYSGNSYYLVEVTENTFKLSLTLNGEAIDLEDAGEGTCSFHFPGYEGYDNGWYEYDKTGLAPYNIVDNYIYMNIFGSNRQTGRLYYEALPDLTADSEDKRVCLGYHDLFVGSLNPDSDYVKEVFYYEFLPDDYPDREQYNFLVNVFDEEVSDGSGAYIIGSGQIQGVFCDKHLMILLTFDDVRGDSGNQSYQKWYSAEGEFRMVWSFPDGYGIAGRIFYKWKMIDVMISLTTYEAHLYVYDLSSGSLISTTLLDNPYLEEEGYYFVTNRQVIDDRYIMLNLSNNSDHCVFFEIGNSYPTNEVIMNWSYGQQTGYRVVPQIGGDEPVSAYNPKLLQLCNDIRNRKMTWAEKQVAVCQDHADWCVSHGVLQHEGPVPGEDGSTSLRHRNDVKGVYGGLAENITLVIEAEDETEQVNAFDAWYNSPHHLENMVRDGNKYMSYAWAKYPSTVTQIICGPGMYLGNGEYSTEETIFEVPEHLRGKYKIYVQNFIWY